MKLPAAPLGASAVLALGLQAAATAAQPLPDSLTLHWLETTVLERNPSLEVAKAAAEEARARARRVGSLADPMLDLMVAPRSLGAESVDPGYRIGATQPLPLFGERGVERRAAQAEARRALQGELATRLDLLQAAREAFFELYRATVGLEMNQALAELLHTFRRVALAKYSAGLVEQKDPLRAELEIAMLDHERAVYARRIRVARARLTALLHLPAGTVLPPPSRAMAAAHPPGSQDSLHAVALRLRPERSAARAGIEARQAGVTLSRRQRWPETSFGVAYDRFMMEPEWRTTVSVEFPLPIQLGRQSAAVAEARAALRGAEAEAARIEDEIGREVEEAIAHLEESHHELEIIRRDLLPVTERTLTATRAAYEANRGDFLALLDAARAFVRTRLMLFETLAMVAERRAALARAVGATEVHP